MVQKETEKSLGLEICFDLTSNQQTSSGGFGRALIRLGTHSISPALDVPKGEKNSTGHHESLLIKNN